MTQIVISAFLRQFRRVGFAGARLDFGSLSAVAAAAAGLSPVAAAAVDAMAGAEPAARILLLPMGTIALRDGRGPFRLDDLAHAEAVVAASLAHAGRTDIVIDYDHQTHYAVGPGKGGRAAAAGWIKRLFADEAGIWGEVEWTAVAAAALRDREYRYISPLFYPDASGRVALLRNAGLVNEPAIESLPAIAAALQETTVDYSKIAAALGLPATATEEDILAALAGNAMMPKDKMVAAATAFGLGADAGLDEIVAAATTAAAAVPDPAKFVPVAVLAETNQRLAVLEGERREALVAAALEAGKLAPAMADWARSLVAKDEAAFTAFVAGAPVIVAAGALDLDADNAVAGAHGLTATELTVAAALGLSAETFAAAKKD